MGIFPTDDAARDAVYAEESAAIDASQAIALALEACRMSRADLARALKISRGEVTARLRGERNITVRKLAATLHALGHRLVIDVVPLEEKPDVVDAAEAAYLKWARAAAQHAERTVADVPHIHERGLARAR